MATTAATPPWDEMPPQMSCSPWERQRSCGTVLYGGDNCWVGHLSSSSASSLFQLHTNCPSKMGIRHHSSAGGAWGPAKLRSAQAAVAPCPCQLLAVEMQVSHIHRLPVAGHRVEHETRKRR